MNAILAIAGVAVKEMYRRKDFYVLFVLTALITLLLGSMSFVTDAQIVRYIKEVCLLLIWISSLVMVITTSARQIPMERENRTIFPLLAKPVTRAQVLLGKFAGCWVACAIMLVCFYAFYGAVSASREHAWPSWVFYQAIWMHWCMLGILAAMALWGSVVFSASSANNTICLVASIGLLLVGRHLNKVALGLAEPGQSLLYAVYFAIPHLEFFDFRDLMIHQWDPAPGTAMVAATLYAWAYTALLLLGAWMSFRRKALN
jgi:Cu-processing system permease protein